MTDIAVVSDGQKHEVWVGGRKYGEPETLAEAVRIENELLQLPQDANPFDPKHRARILGPIAIVDSPASAPSGGSAVEPDLGVSRDQEVVRLQASLGALHAGLSMVFGVVQKLEGRVGALERDRVGTFGGPSAGVASPVVSGEPGVPREDGPGAERTGPISG